MRALIITTLAALLCASCSPSPEPAAEKPKAAEDKGATYLASITVPLGPDERLEAFSFETWGVDVVAVCHIPDGWRITAGRSAAPDGAIAGKSSHGVTWLSDMQPLEGLVLVRLHEPVRERERKDGPSTCPATFSGKANIETGDDAQREAVLSHANVRLVPADRCP